MAKLHSGLFVSLMFAHRWVKLVVLAAILGWLHIVVVVACGLLSGCYNPDLSMSHFRCADNTSGSCPEGFLCWEGRCTLPGDVPDAGSTPDLVSAPPVDMARSGCASGRGTAVGSAFACTGSYNPGQVAAKCAAGYGPCTSAVGIDLNACAQLPGFFLADMVGRYATAGDLSGLQCSGSDYYRAVFGCGNPAKAKFGALACSGFRLIIDCRDIGSEFRCPPPPFEGIDNMTSPYPLNGVLCCAKP